MPDQTAPIFKICRSDEWVAAVAAGYYDGSADDKRDGFIHLSSAAQLAETARKHFRGVDGLVLVAVDQRVLGASLKWEPSRGGELFPHIYGRLPVSAALKVSPMLLDADGIPHVPE